MELSALEKATQGDRERDPGDDPSTVDHLNQTGIPQWDEVYPNAANVDEDIRKRGAVRRPRGGADCRHRHAQQAMRSGLQNRKMAVQGAGL